MKKLLYIGPDITNAYNGGAQGNQHRVHVFEAIFGKNNVECFFVSHPPEKCKILFNNLMLYATDFNLFAEKRVLKKISTGDYDYCFLSRSLLGRIAPKIKKINPSIKIITWFQNIEKYFPNETSYQNFIYKYLMERVSVFNEKRAVKYSDVIIALNKRDDDLMRDTYGRGATIILPIAFHDVFNINQVKKCSNKEIYLFVGSDFRPNIEGIFWFVESVMPFVDGLLQIVGFGLEKYKDKLKRRNVEVIGTVEDIAPYYYSASIVIAPIFKGTGMKTKIAEALMFGKTVLGTTEALQGYKINESVGAICNSSQDFIVRIKNHRKLLNNFNSASRKLFEEEHTILGLEKKLKAVLNLD